jgi:excisionase family DNA binding protein
MSVRQSDRGPMIPPRELADYLGIPPHTLDQWRSQGIGPAFHRVGRHVRYAWADIEEWLGRQRRESARST